MPFFLGVSRDALVDFIHLFNMLAAILSQLIESSLFTGLAYDTTSGQNYTKQSDCHSFIENGLWFS